MRNIIKQLLNLTIVTLLILLNMPFKTVNATGDMTIVQSFYYNPNNPNPDASIVSGGLEYAIRYAATNNNTDAREYSSTNWNANSIINPRTLVGNNADLYNTTDSSNFSLYGTFKNNGASDENINVTMMLPSNVTTVKPDPTRITSNPLTGNYSSNLTFKYRTSSGDYTYDQILAMPGFDWNTVGSVLINGKLHAGENAVLDLPLTLPTTSIEARTKIYSYTPGTPRQTFINVKTIERRYFVSDYEYGVYIGTTRDASGAYTQVPANIQALMPLVNSNDIIYSAFNLLNLPVDFTETSNPIAFSNSMYGIRTSVIFDAVKDEGYSTAVINNQLINGYRYLMTSNANISDRDGNPIQPGTFDNDAGVQLSRYYVQLIKVLDTQDLTLHVGDAWDPYDNLTYHQYDTTPIALSDVSITHNDVDLTTPGNYTVTYSTQVAPGAIVTKTAKVNVVRDATIDYAFVSDNGMTLPTEVTSLLPATHTSVPTGTVVNAIDPTPLQVTTTAGTWSFLGYDNFQLTANGNNMTFTGTWSYRPNGPAITSPIAPSQPSQPTQPAQPTVARTPQTSDQTHLALFASLFAISIISVAVLALRRITFTE
ncbi:MAG: SHIRT domain-containing protein [Erysipelotrichaceae bacterium]|nr:SHIRT domain-containing protein [Erysipelotrichaceae bacterium]